MLTQLPTKLNIRISAPFLEIEDLTLPQATKHLEQLNKRALGTDWRDVRRNMHKRTLGKFLLRTIETLLSGVASDADFCTEAGLHKIANTFFVRLGSQKAKGEIASYTLHNATHKGHFIAFLALSFVEASYEPSEIKPEAFVVITTGRSRIKLF